MANTTSDVGLPRRGQEKTLKQSLWTEAKIGWQRLSSLYRLMHNCYRLVLCLDVSLSEFDLLRKPEETFRCTRRGALTLSMNVENNVFLQLWQRHQFILFLALDLVCCFSLTLISCDLEEVCDKTWIWFEWSGRVWSIGGVPVWKFFSSAINQPAPFWLPARQLNWHLDTLSTSHLNGGWVHFTYPNTSYKCFLTESKQLGCCWTQRGHEQVELKVGKDL